MPGPSLLVFTHSCITYHGSSMLNSVGCKRHWYFFLFERLKSNHRGCGQLERLSRNEVVVITQNKPTTKTAHNLQKFWDARSECLYLRDSNPISVLRLFRSANPIFLKFIYFHFLSYMYFCVAGAETPMCPGTNVKVRGQPWIVLSHCLREGLLLFASAYPGSSVYMLLYTLLSLQEC